MYNNFLRRLYLFSVIDSLHLGNGKGGVVVNGKRAAIVGNICMDVCMIDVTDIDCKPGDRVEIFGEQLPVTGNFVKKECIIIS